MARPNIAYYRRAQERRPLDRSAVAECTGLSNSSSFRQLMREAELALDRYYWERAAGRDEARHLLAGLRTFRDRLADAQSAHRRLASGHFEGIFDGLVLDAIGTLRPFVGLDRRLTNAIEACDVTLAVHSRIRSRKPEAAVWSGTPFDLPSPRHARRRLAERLARHFRHHAPHAMKPQMYEAALHEFLKTVFTQSRISWSDNETVFRKLIPAHLRTP